MRLAPRPSGAAVVGVAEAGGIVEIAAAAVVAVAEAGDAIAGRTLRIQELTPVPAGPACSSGVCLCSELHYREFAAGPLLRPLSARSGTAARLMPSRLPV